MKHLRYGGSTINRTLNCAGWRKLADQMPPSSSSSFADEGTLLHNCAEEYFDKGVGTGRMLEEGREYNGIVLTEELVEAKLNPAIRAVIALHDKYEIHDFVCEPFVEIIPDQAGGSIDMLCIGHASKTCLVIDYKFGHNTVLAAANAQMLFYALCADVDPETAEQIKDVENLVLVIVQPNDDGGIADVYECEINVLDDFEDRVVKAIHKAENADVTTAASRAEILCAGPWCQYCPAEGICDVKLGTVAKAQRLDLTDANVLVQAMALVAEMESWTKAVKKLAHEQMENGVAIKGFKLVNKRATRVWNNPEVTEKRLRNMRKLKISEAQEHKLKSPAQMEKLFKQKGLDFKPYNEHISAVSSGTTLAKESDKRPAVVPTLALKALADRL